MKGWTALRAVEFAVVSVLSACSQRAIAGQGTITVPGNDLVVSGKYTRPADKSGGFIIGIRLPQKNIRASGCGESGALLIQMAGNDVIGKPTPAEQALIRRKTRYFETLHEDAASTRPVSITVEGSRTYLRKSGRVLDFPYCIAIFSGFGE